MRNIGLHSLKHLLVCIDAHLHREVVSVDGAHLFQFVGEHIEEFIRVEGCD